MSILAVYILITAHHVKNMFQIIEHRVQKDTTCKYWILPSQCKGGSCCAALNLHGHDFRNFPSLWVKYFDTQNKLQHNVFIYSLSPALLFCTLLFTP